MPKFKDNRGFTLIEILLVVVIIGLMLAVIVPRAWRANIDAKYGLVRQNCSELATFDRDDTMSNEADTCRKYVVPNLTQAGWDHQPHSIAEQRTFTDGRIMVAGNKVKRRKPKRADDLLRQELVVARGKCGF